MRQHVTDWSKHHLGRPIFLVGASPALLRLEEDIKRVSTSPLPVLIIGEHGTEKTYAALAIHACSSRQMYPFIELDCAQSSVSFSEQIARAHKGTLFLNNLHLLTLEQQSELRGLFFSHLEQWISSSGHNDVRFISASTEDSAHHLRSGIFLQDLFSELSILSVNVPPLRHRKDDIHLLLDYFHSRFSGTNNNSCYNEIVNFLMAYEWPGNLCELAKVVAMLGIMTEGEPVTMEDVQRYTPWLLASSKGGDMFTSQISPNANISTSILHETKNETNNHSRRQPYQPTTVHNGLCKAMEYIRDNFKSQIYLNELARYSSFSPSHLSFLFRKELCASFKHLQHYHRIQEAKILLINKMEASVSDVAGMVGYSSIGQFERYFRKAVGKTPRDYRRSIRFDSSIL
jgi:DNA-binding NtrC family response regulator